PKAEVIQKAEKNNIPVKIFAEADWQNVEAIIAYLRSYRTQYIILAGYLQLLPSVFIQAFPHRILNIHPALLPKYGGKGMYGKYVHEKVFENKETETGITVHELNEKYDEGKIIFQKTVSVEENDSSESIEKKVRKLELKYFPEIVEEFILQKNKLIF
ncbi:MAG: phosphoribosylglycinamide formyltransferase, partial [Fimbriimonadaceae bacterium]|nr:phosphoribosylglycinamide formyltransferase [Chitinophagales bacterium]